MAVINPAGKQGEYAIESGLIQKTVCSLFRPAVQRVVFQNPAVVFRVHFGTQFPERFFTRGTAPGQLGIQDHGGVTIGDGCQIGHNVVFATLNHGLVPKDRKTTYPAPIILGKNVWIGSNATILQDVSIGDNAIIGAGAVVTKNVEANTIVGGSPARFIKSIENK